MADSKKLIGYTGSLTNVSVPTAVNTQLVRQIANATFSSTSVETVNVDTYANDISGAPWGAQNVVWLKEPTCTISFNANGGSGSMSAQQANVGIAYKVPQCQFVGAAKASFSSWAIDSISGSTIAPGTQYAFPKSTELYALWSAHQKWHDNNMSTWAEANNEGWSGSANMVKGFTATIDPSSTYNIPKTINGVTIDTVYGYGMRSKAFVEIGGKGIKVLDYEAFSNCTSLKTISFPECTLVSYGVFKQCTSLESVDMPKCSLVSGYGFYYCRNLTHVSLPNCQKVDIAAFSNCPITYLNMPNCRYVGNQAFPGCSITELSLPLCSYAEEYAFSGMYKLRSIDLPICVSLGRGAFNYCYSLASISIPECGYIGYGALGGTKWMEYQWSSASVIKLTTTKQQFLLGVSYNYSLSTFIDNSVTFVCGFVTNNSYVTTVSLPKCETILDMGFYMLSNLTSVSLPACKIFSDYCFRGCSKLSQIELPSCHTLGNYGFWGCTSLTTASFPVCSYLKGYGIFSDCTALQNAYFLSTSVATMYATNEFSGCTSLQHIYVPSSLVNAYKTATNWSFYSSYITAYGG